MLKYNEKITLESLENFKGVDGPIDYVILDENTLGLLWRASDNSKSYSVEPLVSNRFGYYWGSGPVIVTHMLYKVRKATISDCERLNYATYGNQGKTLRGFGMK